MNGLFKKNLRDENVICMLWISLCFAFTSAVYLSWLDRLVLTGGSPAADWTSMVAGYLFQVAGMGTAVFLQRRKQARTFQGAFVSTAVLFSVVMIPTLLSDALVFIICFGSLMNYLCGIIAGFYLYATGLRVRETHRGLVFGGGYAAATVAVGLLALIGKGRLLHGKSAIPIYLVMAAGLLFMTVRLGLFRTENPGSDPEKELSPDTVSAEMQSQKAAPQKIIPISETSGKKSPRNMPVSLPAASGASAAGASSKAVSLLLACGIVILISVVKNLGFGFPSSDIEAGLIPEISRIPYAAGLAAAGFLNDKNRRTGMVCTIAALIVPFIMLGLAGEPLSSTVFWGLDYLFFGFFSVFRVVLFLDIASQTQRPFLAPLGLLMGRLGDAAGAALCLLLADSKTALILISTILFFPAVFLLFSLYQKLYEPEESRQKSEQEVFEAFCLHNDLSAREREIFQMIIAGHTNGEIAEALFISENTVKYHVRNLLQKTGCKNRSELQKKYMLSLYPGLESKVSH